MNRKRHHSPKVICRDCKNLRFPYNNVDLCRGCYLQRKRQVYLSRGIEFPKNLGKKWSWEALESAMRKT